MKLYQIIAFAILSVMYIATIFGPDPALPYVPEDICDLIDEFCSGKKELNDRYYEETGHLKPYFRLLNLLTSLTMVQTWQNLPKNFLQFTIFQASYYTVFSILFLKLLPKIFPTLYKTLPSILLVGIFSNFLLALPMAFGTDLIVAKIAKQLSHSRLTIKSPTRVTVLSYLDEIVVENTAKNIREIRSLSNMQLKCKYSIPGACSPLTDLQLKKRDGLGLIYKLNDDGEIDIYLSKEGIIDLYLDNYDYSVQNELLNSDYQSGDKLRRLPTPAGVISFDVSQIENRLVALYEDGSLHQLELRNRPSLHEIMDSE